MNLKSAGYLIALLLIPEVAGVARDSAAAEPPTPAQALSLAPLQPLVDYTVPPKDEVDKCTVRLEKESVGSAWVVRNRQGDVLRRFYDTNGDNYVDMWCYYLNGVEVYRDIDSDFNNKADQYRWFNTAGTRWAIDKNEDGRIDSWKVISPQEVAEQVVLALKSQDQTRFELLLLTPSELGDLGFGKARTDSIDQRIKSAPTAFAKIIANQSVVTSKTHYTDFSSGRPGTIPIGTAGSTKDITVCDNATALVQTDTKHDQIYLGTLVAVGNTWKLIDAPAVGVDSQPMRGGLLVGPSSLAPSVISGDHPPNDKMQKLMAQLEQLDKASDSIEPDKLAANIEQRVDILQNLADVSPEKDRGQWYRQIADILGMAIQSGNYPKGTDQLEQLQKKLTDDKADEDLIAHVAFQRLWAQFAVSQHDPSADAGKLQEKWLTDLQAFVSQYPKCTDTAEALFQLGMYQEFMGKSADAAKSYQQLVTNFPKANSAEKAKGALQRLNSVGKVLALRGSTIDGGTIDISSPKYRGKVVLVHYWATIGERWKEDMVLLRDFYAKKGGSDFQIIGVCLDDDPSAAKEYLAQNKIPWKQIYEPGGLDGRLANEMGVLTLPLMVLVDQKGNVANQNVQIAQLEAELVRLTKPAADTANASRGAPTSR
ncbi:MAG TPA: thioredoxin-like domain-containing protein [Lacipirellulaceae bacterium]|nr:thioredoxin-like domain-containing protein [Lacipirellulaceae bacterium]